MGGIMWRVLLFALACWHGSAVCSPLRVAFNSDKPPFAFIDASGKPAGTEIDILGTALERLGHQLVPVAVSKARLEVTVRAGQADIGLSVQGKDGDGLYYSDYFSKFENVAVSRKADKVSLRHLGDLDKYRFVIWQGAWNDLGPDFAARYKPNAQGQFPTNYVQSSSQEIQSRAFWNKRVEVIVVDRAIFAWYRRQLAASVKTDEELVFHDIFDSTTNYGAVFSDKALRDRVNGVLRAMHDDGSIRQILARYR
jgi:polar amino acid transport system substrate-binding protein